jgi:hypothetical protein
VVGGWWLVVGGWWLVVGGWWLVVGGWWLVVGNAWKNRAFTCLFVSIIVFFVFFYCNEGINRLNGQ